jgi:hypothetical protein
LILPSTNDDERERVGDGRLWPVIERQKRVSSKLRVESDEQDFLDSVGSGGQDSRILPLLYSSCFWGSLISLNQNAAAVSGSLNFFVFAGGGDWALGLGVTANTYLTYFDSLERRVGVGEGGGGSGCGGNRTG